MQLNWFAMKGDWINSRANRPVKDEIIENLTDEERLYLGPNDELQVDLLNTLSAWLRFEPSYDPNWFSAIGQASLKTENPLGWGIQQLRRADLSEERKAIIYARIMWAQQSIFGDSIADKPELEWDYLFKAFDLLIEECPSDMNKDALRYFVCLQGDQSRAKKLLSEAPLNSVSKIWNESDYPFEDWKSWANGKEAESLQPAVNGADIVGIWQLVEQRGDYPMSIKKLKKETCHYVFFEDNRLEIHYHFANSSFYKQRTWEFHGAGHYRFRFVGRPYDSDAAVFLSEDKMRIQHSSLGTLILKKTQSYLPATITDEEIHAKITEEYARPSQ
jgi:hypothetical protein